MTDYTDLRNWSPDQLARELRAAEDVAFHNTKTIIQLMDALDGLMAQIERGPWDHANAKRVAMARGKAAQARALHDQGLTVPQIMAKVHRCRKTVDGYLAGRE